MTCVPDKGKVVEHGPVDAGVGAEPVVSRRPGVTAILRDGLTMTAHLDTNTIRAARSATASTSLLGLTTCLAASGRRRRRKILTTSSVPTTVLGQPVETGAAGRREATGAVTKTTAVTSRMARAPTVPRRPTKRRPRTKGARTTRRPPTTGARDGMVRFGTATAALVVVSLWLLSPASGTPGDLAAPSAASVDGGTPDARSPRRPAEAAEAWERRCFTSLAAFQSDPLVRAQFGELRRETKRMGGAPSIGLTGKGRIGLLAYAQMMPQGVSGWVTPDPWETDKRIRRGREVFSFHNQFGVAFIIGPDAWTQDRIAASLMKALDGCSGSGARWVEPAQHLGGPSHERR